MCDFNLRNGMFGSLYAFRQNSALFRMFNEVYKLLNILMKYDLI